MCQCDVRHHFPGACAQNTISQPGICINAFDASRAEWLAADVFAHLRKLRDQGRRFGLIILDPPKFAPTEKHVAKAARAYKDINLWAMKLLAPRGRGQGE